MQPSIRIFASVTLAFLAPAAAHGQTPRDLYAQMLQTLTASDGAVGDSFGFSISLSGDTLAVGVPFDDVGVNANQGSVRIFVRNGQGWVLQQTLTQPLGAADDAFGWSVSLSGDTLAVGIPGDEVGANTDQGSVQIFNRFGAVWVSGQVLTAADAVDSDDFGSLVELSGDTVVVAMPRDDVGANANQGSVRVFTRSGTVWGTPQTLTAADGAANDEFGRDISISGEWIAVGVPFDDVGTNANQGSVRIFKRSGTTWTAAQTLLGSQGASQDWFGYSVSMSGDALAVGAPLDEVGTVWVDEGSVRMFGRNGESWLQETTLTAADAVGGDFFGLAVSLSGDTLAASAPNDIVGQGLQRGSVRMLVRNGGSWTEQAMVTTAYSPGFDNFGEFMLLAGETLAVALPSDGVGTNEDQGSVRIFGNHRVLNDTTNIGYPSLASAIAASSAGDRLVVGSRAFSEATGIIDASQKRFTFTAVEPLVLAEGALLNLANDTVFEKSLDVDAGGLTIAGKLQAPVGGNLVFAQLAVTNEGQFSQRGASIAVNQGLSSESGGVCYLKGSVLAETVSTAVGGQNRVAGDTDVFADYTNAGATIIQRGILYIYGSLVNTGTITGQFNNGFLPPEPGDGYSVSGDYIMSADASVILSDPVWWLRTSGNFDVAINDASRFDFGQATLELASDNPKAPQSAEVLSRDLGAADAGFATTNFPLGSLRLRAGANAELVDNHNNAPGKQAEAIYTQELVVPAGATLVTNGLKVYTRVATIAGTVSSPSDIVVVPGTPPCVADIVADGVVNGADLALVLTNWGPCATSTCVADIDRNGTVDAADLSAVLVGWGGCAD